jgi:hypothetical protein
MSLRRAEPRFALPLLPRRAVILGGLEGWRRGLEQASVETVDAGERAELVVAPAALSREAVALAPETIIIEGGGAGMLRAAGYTVRRLLLLPDRGRPNLLLSPGEPEPSRYAIRHFRRGDNVSLRIRNVLARELLARGLVPPAKPSWRSPLGGPLRRRSSPKGYNCSPCPRPGGSSSVASSRARIRAPPSSCSRPLPGSRAGS